MWHAVEEKGSELGILPEPRELPHYPELAWA